MGVPCASTTGELHAPLDREQTTVDKVKGLQAKADIRRLTKSSE
jgi:hypothetical protein